ncbi:MAG: GntP family permease [Opitutaceae bacterium]
MASPPLAIVPGPLTVLFLSVVFIVVVIAWLRLHAFFALLFAAMFVGLLTALGQTGDGRFIKTVEAVMNEFGIAAGKIGFTIAIASVIGVALMESGAADKIIRRFIAVLGEQRASFALLACGFVLGIPVFFDTVFFLLVPLARALSLRTGKDYMLYVLAICAGGVITHGTVPPTPGPLVVAETLNIDLGITIVGGILFGVLPALVGLAFARWINKRMPVPVREASGSTLASLEEVAGRREDQLPGFWISIAPVILPVILIAAASSLAPVRASMDPAVVQTIEFFGNKNIALLIGACIALVVYARQKKLGMKQLGEGLGPPLEVAGVIILITSAGGAYGAMIKNSGVGDSVRAMADGTTVNYVLLAWVLSAVVRVAQGSATVAMITASSIMLSIAGTEGFGVHPLYVFLAVGYGAAILSWMNDSGFWVISRLGGLTEGETLRSWTVLLTIISIAGLVQIMIAAAIWPNLWF